MAKGNMLLGYSRGSVGDVTFYRDGGQQRARARNRKPNNPRSNRQMYQRAKFAGAVKFFKQSLANFYKMAFENKKPNESDYNAFMRVNLAQSPLMSKSAFDKPGYPAIGHWTIAQGSMPTLQFVKNYGTQEDKLAVILPVQTSDNISNNTTIGEFSTILINSGLYQPGDIFTMVRVRVDADVETLATLPTATPGGNWNTYWFVTQILLDTADTRKIGLELLREDAGELIYKNTDGNIYIANGGDDGMSIVTTRNTPNGLKASNSEIVVTDTIDAAITTAEGDNYKNAVLADWRASGENILQGALAEPYVNPFDGATVTGTVTVAQDEGGTNSTDIDITNGAVEIPHSLSFLFEVQQVVKFKSAALAQKVFNETAGTSSGDSLKYPDTFSVMYGSANTGLDVCTLRISGDTLTYGIRANIGQTDCYHITDEGSIAVSVAPFENSIAATWEQPIALINRGTGMDNPTEPPITVECKVSPPEYGNMYYFWFKGKEGANMRQGLLKIVRNGSTASDFGSIGAPFLSVDGGYQWEYDSPQSAGGNWQVGATAEIQYDGQTIVNIVVVA